MSSTQIHLRLAPVERTRSAEPRGEAPGKPRQIGANV